jgi:hypothetical protein
MRVSDDARRLARDHKPGFGDGALDGSSLLDENPPPRTDARACEEDDFDEAKFALGSIRKDRIIVRY